MRNTSTSVSPDADAGSTGPSGLMPLGVEAGGPAAAATPGEKARAAER